MVALGVATVCDKGGQHHGGFGGGWPEPFLRWGSPSLFHGITFPDVRIGFWKWGPKLADWCWDYWSHFVFHLQESFHLFNDVRLCRWSLVVQGMHLISWVVLSLLKICVPCIDVTLTSTSTTSIGSLHLKKLCRKLCSCLE